MAAINWKNPVNGDWSVASNWSTNTVPTSGDAVTISAPGSYTVTISSADLANSLTFNASQAALLETGGSLTVTGALTVDSGFVSLSETNTIGSVALAGGVLGIGKGAALGTGTLTVTSGELLGTATATVANSIALSAGSTTTFAAAPGTTLNLTGGVDFVGNDTVDIGGPGENGEVLWSSSPSGDTTDTFDVLDGTLTAANSELGFILNLINGTTVAAGATLDWAGNAASIKNLQGAGVVTNSGAAQTMTLSGTTSFSGAISGALSVVFNGNAALSGLEDYTGGATIDGSDTVSNTGAYDIVANTNIAGAATATFVNNDLFEKTAGGGVSQVTSNFVNNGTLDVLRGSVQFSGGFTNNGVIHGLVTKSGTVTTISAPVPSDFNGDASSDILWHNDDGQVAIWEINGTSQIPGGSVVLATNPGPSWNEIASGDFNGDGHADILWQNANGQAAIWEMNGTNLIGGGNVSLNAGPGWKAIGTGDFNADGLADILLQNTSSGQAAIWEMNGTNVIGGGAVTPNPGPSWQAIGTGDFNGDGHSDILWQNTSTGQTAVWEMNGSTLIGGGNVSLNAGPGWKAVGTGDFDGDGKSDILLQNPSSGQVAIWEMNGTNVIGGGAVSSVPGASWHATGTGDFNGDGKSDILWQNDGGQVAIWEMNGINQIPGGSQVLSSNPGSTWHEIKA
jgi:hypothetical protein